MTAKTINAADQQPTLSADLSADALAAADLAAKLAATTDLRQRLVIIRQAIAGDIVFSTSLGLEDQVLTDAIAGSGADIALVTLDTGRHFPETLETIQVTELRYGLKIRVVYPDKAEVEALVAKDGIFGFRDAVENRKACCHVRKVRPLNIALEGASGWITGMRRDQSDERAETPFAEVDGERNLIKINTLADWSLDDVEEFVKSNDVPINALHAQGFPSIGCQPCTRAIEPGEDIRAGRWWWENEDGKECGLHNRPTQ